MLDTIYCLGEPEEVAERFKQRLLGIADKAMTTRWQNVQAKHRINSAEEARKRITISEEYAEEARIRYLAKLVKVPSQEAANLILARKVAMT